MEIRAQQIVSIKLTADEINKALIKHVAHLGYDVSEVVFDIDTDMNKTNTVKSCTLISNRVEKL